MKFVQFKVGDQLSHTSYIKACFTVFVDVEERTDTKPWIL
jgi:hypothetical protein